MTIDLNKRQSGVLLHVTSLPGPHGAGDFGPEAFRFVDWLQSAGQSIWQWLPSTPIGPGESPYQGVSAFAGNPWLVAFEPLVEKGWLAQPVPPEGGFDAARVEYGRMIPWREQQLRAAAAGFFAKGSATDRAAYELWCVSQRDWLQDYALFMAIRSRRDGQGWWDWPRELSGREPRALVAAREQYADEVAFWQFVQWCFDVQVGALKAYANERGVHIMGDLPIFVAHDSADCWARPDLYEFDAHFQPTVVAGVPPDAMAATGQRWGNPMYRWDKMAHEHFAWWTARVKRMLSSADVFRIDHFRGFAAYYEIPADSPDATRGVWKTGPGKALFDAIAKSLGELPIVAEDLGFITPDVHELRDSLAYPGMKILQFGFGGDGTHEFLPHNWPRAAVCYTGTHDNDTVRGWWNQASAHERALAAAYLDCGDDDLHWAMIRACANSVANMAVYPLQDVLGLDSRHRMNIPGTLGGNWEWRFTWDMVGVEPGRRLGLIAATSGRAPIAGAGLPE